LVLLFKPHLVPLLREYLLPTMSAHVCYRYTEEHGGEEGAARAFFEEYVSKRKPVVIRGVPDGRWKGHLWSKEYLADKAGQCAVKVERRESPQARFGR
jgi:hypothetical protein